MKSWILIGTFTGLLLALLPESITTLTPSQAATTRVKRHEMVSNLIKVSFSGLGNVSDIKMFGPRDGWAASDRGVFRTSDEGVHWIQTLKGDANFKTNGQTDFLNEDTAYVVLPINNRQSHLFSTHDGGRHWKNSLIGAGAQTVIQMSFANAHAGWVMTAPGGAAGPFEPVAIFRIMDGGQHTSLIVPAPVESMESHGIPQGALKTGIYFESASVGWITADTWGNYLWLYQTVDGGLLWRNRSINAIPPSLKRYLGGDQLPGNPVFFNSTKGVLPVDFIGGGSCLYVTTDGGVHWHYTRPLLGKSYIQYDILDSKHIFAVMSRTLYESKDLGRSWMVVGRNLPADTSVDFVSSRIGYATGTTLWRTSNGGSTWNIIR